jgi:hypothetical protein
MGARAVGVPALHVATHPCWPLHLAAAATQRIYLPTTPPPLLLRLASIPSRMNPRCQPPPLRLPGAAPVVPQPQPSCYCIFASTELWMARSCVAHLPIAVYFLPP